MTKKISILGSTGSIGTQALECIAASPDQFEVVALAAGKNIDLLTEQALKFQPKCVSVSTRELANEIRNRLPQSIKVVQGDEALVELAAHPDADIVLTAMVGSAGLQPTLAAIDAGKNIALANKETLVSAGHIVMDRAKQKGVSILPVDSEHSALFQCLNGEFASEVNKLVLTASGGSFRDLSRDQLKEVTVEQALKHPNWSMGAKITIDSATMVNKGLEVIEARWLFDVSYDQIEVLLHPESIIHSYVEFVDRSIIAQLGLPDMRVPIQYAFTYPHRTVSPAQSLDFAQMNQLTFRKMDFERYPCLKLAFDAGRSGGTAPTVFNAANEVAVARFLNREISFLSIESVIYEALNKHQVIANPALEEIQMIDQQTRDFVRSLHI
jgi:1-deoxy-D-xylulose-5-phosphate reductoisomerase